VGAACALAFATDRATVGVVGLAVVVGVISLVIRNLWGVIVCVALGAICFGAWNYGATWAQVLMVVSATVLCLGGLRAVTEEMASVQPGGTGDTQVASAALWLPAGAWGLVLLVWGAAWTGWATWQVIPAL
jgi:hypothetical protein